MSMPAHIPSCGVAKVTDIAHLAMKSRWQRTVGRKVVHAHGCFDLLHPGHIAHLKSARAMGDMLVVTVTSDRYVNKGPGRPVYGEAQRAEMLAALECVDHVAISDAPDGVEAIEALRPAIYVKGKDYRGEDITGRLDSERATVEACGGTLVITDDELMSSTALINRHLNGFDPQVREHLDSLRPHLSEILDLIESVKDYRVLMVGDAIIDEYVYVQPMGKPPKESVLATRYRDTEVFAGGVFAAANHLSSFVRQVDVITCVGDAESHKELSALSFRRRNVDIKVLAREGAPTTRKTRWVDHTSMRKLFEVYRIDDSPSTAINRELGQMLLDVSGYDLVIAADFGHGLIGPDTVEVLSRAPFLAVNTQTNSGNYGYNLVTKYKTADYICIDAPEARLAAGDRFASLALVAERLSARLDCPRLVITQGKEGSHVYERGDGGQTLPALAKSVVDTVGAGDAVFAVTAPLVKAGGPMDRIGFIGNVVGAMAVGIVGNRSSVEKVDLIRSITGLLK